MSVKRKSHNLDEVLLERARRALGAATETDTIHEALRAVVLADEVMTDLHAARGTGRKGGAGLFRNAFVRQMKAERRAR